MNDLLIRNARVAARGPEPCDVRITGGRIAAIGADLPAAAAELDAAGGMLTPSFVELHCHLDATLTAGTPRPNRSGTLWEGIALWSEIKPTLDEDSVYRRARKTLLWMLSHGVTHVRTHVDICDPSLVALRALLRLRADLRGTLDLQLVAFPQEGFYAYADGEALMLESIALGVDCLGGIPHFEITREDGVRSVERILSLAREHQRRVDIHCDETDDDQSRFVEVMAARTLREGLEGRVTASHLTASHGYHGAYAGKLIGYMRRAGLHVVTNPLDNSVLQGRFDGYPMRRGHARIKEMLQAGLNVACGHDSVMDPWYPMGDGDPLKAAFVLMHYAQLIGADERPWLFRMLTGMPAAAFGLERHAVVEGAPADLILWDVPTEDEALRRLPARRAVLRNGTIVAERSAVGMSVLGEPLDTTPPV
ncbi:cytosine deaminase [Acidihalobacter ferrooxydans]|uniref:Cytosine deaminase n=1 Tax=Acidihalobacter ferrooxydans TaxID=1765967 RepID=A0A1P8UGM2_9GAMM|nr:cytosine deaminase [Acidihalobacter ferrooxydans]APZ42960.1 cytosine deaminase [Acidihalobacter ferrooxydans]